ncbi:MAG: response regulator [Minwuia sp.]|nr:response regulator [Minwuia sp.]
MSENQHILIVDDDSRLRGLLRRFLGDNGFRVSEAADTTEAERRLSGIEFDLIILDVMLPGEDGRQFAIRLLGTGRQVPILMLTALGDAEDRISGLETGVDDYLTKPFEPKELLLRIRSVLRRGIRPRAASVLSFGAFRFDRSTNRLTCDSRPVRLTSGEAQLLQTLTARPGETVSREALVGDEGDPSGRAIDVQVTRLRRKLEDDPRQPEHLQTVRGEGYVLWATATDA